MTSTEVLTISQAAKRAGWSRRRMYRFLLAQRSRLLDQAAAEHLDRCTGPVERYETKGGEE